MIRPIPMYETNAIQLHFQCSCFDIYHSGLARSVPFFVPVYIVKISTVSCWLFVFHTYLSANFNEHTTQTVRNRFEKYEHIGKAIIDILFMIQSHAESMKKILGALQDLPANQQSQSSQIPQKMAEWHKKNIQSSKYGFLINIGLLNLEFFFMLSKETSKLETYLVPALLL